MQQIQINNIDDLIKLVETDALTDNRAFSDIIKETLNVLCIYNDSMTKAFKLNRLKLWRDKLQYLENRPLFFEQQGEHFCITDIYSTSI